MIFKGKENELYEYGEMHRIECIAYKGECIKEYNIVAH